MRYYHFRSFDGPDALRLDSADEPAPGPRQVLLRMRAWSLNYRDLLISTNSYGRGLKPDLVPLSDGAGEVVALGTEATRWRVGDRVMPIFMPRWLDGPPDAAKVAEALGGPVHGVLAEYVVADESALVAIPPELGFAQAATLPCAAVTAWHAIVALGQVVPGQTVLTLGSGGVSVFALQLAAAAGAHVIATSGDDAKLARLAELGAAELVNYRDTPDWGRAVARLSGGGVDHVVEVGGDGTLPQSVTAARAGGRISLIGVLAAGDGVPSGHILRKGLTVQGMYVGSRAMFADLVRALRTLRIQPVVDRSFPFGDAAAAYGHLASRRHFGKVVIEAD